jgi:23S rRNA (guanosine2251-2'-O)-methyltransferase
MKEEMKEPANLIMGRNPVREAIKKGASIERILVMKGHTDGSVREILNGARDRRIVIIEVAKQKLDELCLPFGYGDRTGNHQGIVALLPEKEYCSIDDMLAYAAQKAEPPLLLLLDGIQDPHNLGAILRSAEAMGAHGVILPKRRSAPLNAAAAKASAGAIEYVRIARVANLTAAIEELKQKGLWIAGAVMDGQPAEQADLKGPIAFVIGSEGEGVSRLIRKNCDFLLRIPMAGHIASLNASVAAGILLYERARQCRS